MLVPEISDIFEYITDTCRIYNIYKKKIEIAFIGVSGLSMLRT
jgi:hypothetical protein